MDHIVTFLSLVAGLAPAEIYPMELVLAILRGIKLTMEARNVINSDFENERADMTCMVMNPLHAMDTDGPEEPEDSVADSEADVEPTETVSQKENTTDSLVPIQDGGSFRVLFTMDKFKPIYRDEYTGEELPRGLVINAMKDELV